MAEIIVSGDKPKKSFKKVALPTLSKRAKLLTVLVLIALLIAGGWIFYSKYNHLKKENARLSDPQASAKQESQQLKDTVSKLIELPSNEDPTIASVVDATKLKTQAFFANAQNGDKVLLFSQAKKAVLYRPSTNKIIEVAPINIGNSDQTTPAGTSQSPATKAKQ